MAKFYSSLTPQLLDFIHVQRLFFTATAPEAGRINLSPKGMDTFRILSDRQVAYLDLTGSGNETAAHLTQSSRMTIMFCSFDSDPLILRLYGKGWVIRPRDHEWETMAQHFQTMPGERQIIGMDIESLQTSCGWAVPYYSYAGERDMLARWAEKKGPEGLRQYWEEKNQTSIDGLSTELLRPGG
jgi:hypothetical protein